MPDISTKPEMPRRLAEVLAEGPRWTVTDRLRIIRRLAQEVHILHQDGRTHRAIDAEAVSIDTQLQPQLASPVGPRRFGGEHSDPEFCPPELAEGSDVQLPEHVEQALAVLRKQGYEVSPERIDVYQLGVLLCRLLSGASLREYMYQPAVKQKIPVVARSLLQQALGFDPEHRLTDCSQLIEALDEVIDQAGSQPVSAPMTETPLAGQIRATGDDTQPYSDVPASRVPDDAPLPFERLGHFRLRRRIGHGGMGDVYQAHDETLDRQVAIKVLPPELARDEDFVHRFQAEATAVAGLTHPNVVPVYFIGQDAGHRFFAMQYIEGQSLAERISEDQSLPLDQVQDILEQCLAGLEAAHSQGLIHRDIKPSNILLDSQSDRAVLVDFGLVRRLGPGEGITTVGTVLGTVDYIAPEQVTGGTIDGRADLYALGVLAYQLLSGRLPFMADTPVAMIFQHAYEEPVSLGEIAPDVPQPIQNIVARMMAKHPDDRYASCAEALADLEAYREGRPILAPNPDFQADLRRTVDQLATAIAEHQRHRDQLTLLLNTTRNAAADLSTKITEQEQSAPAVKPSTAPEEAEAMHAKQKEHEEGTAMLKSQQEEQTRQIEDVERELSEVGATLKRLQGQWDGLKSRLEAAEATSRSKRRSRKRRYWWVAVAVVAVCLAASVSVRWILSRSALEEELSGPADSASICGTVFEDLNGDGVHDKGESGVKGATVQLQRIEGDGKLLQTFLNPTPVGGDKFGQSVTGVDNKIVVSAVNDGTGAPGAGAAYLFDSTTGELLHTFLNPTPNAEDYFGQSTVVMGNRVLISDHAEDSPTSDAGAVHMFDLSSGKLLQTFSNSAGAAGEVFMGVSLAATEKHVLAGVFHNPEGNGVGRWFDASSGKLLHTFAMPDKSHGRWDCWSAAIAGGNALLGNIVDGRSAPEGGAAYLFDSGTGELLHVFLNPTPDANDHFGYAVAGLEDRVIVGAMGDDTSGIDAGIVHMFDATSGELVRTFHNPHPYPNDLFGSSVAASGNFILIGARFDHSVGVVYLFDASTGLLLHTYQSPSPTVGNAFGISLALVDGKVLIGAIGDDTDGVDTGAAYLFEGVRGSDSVEMVTEGEGKYDFSDLQLGDYAIRVLDRDGYAITSAKLEHGHLLNIRGGKAVSGPNFGLRQTTPRPEIVEGEWVELLDSVDISKDWVSGQWQRKGEDVVCLRDHWSKMMLPVTVSGDYDLEVEFTRAEGADSAAIVFPVGWRACNVVFGAGAHGLENIDGKSALYSPIRTELNGIKVGQRYRATVRVRLQEIRSAQVEILLDGEPCLSWSGSQDSLTPYESWNPPNWARPTIGAFDHVIFHRAALRLESGKASWIE